MNAILRATPDSTSFNQAARLPDELRMADFELAMQDIYDLLFDINAALVSRGLLRLEDTVRPAIFSGIMSDALTASLGRHSRVLTVNRYHNGHPDLIPEGRYANNAVRAGNTHTRQLPTQPTRGARHPAG